MSFLGIGRKKRVVKKTDEEIVAEVAKEKILVFEGLRDAAESFINSLGEVRLLLQHPQPLKSEKDKLEIMEATLSRVVRGFQAGFSLTTPNKEWYCGVIEKRLIMYHYVYYWHRRGILEKITKVNPKNEDKEQAMLVYTGVIPAEAQKKIVIAREIFDEELIFVCSPQITDFRVPELCPDPVAIAMIQDVPNHGDLFFEVARWDVKKDLEVLLGKTQ